MGRPQAKEIVLNYLYNIATWASQGVNVIVLGGDPDESLSSRAGKNIRDGGFLKDTPLPLCLRKHFLKSIEEDRGKDTIWGRITRV